MKALFNLLVLVFAFNATLTGDEPVEQRANSTQYAFQTAYAAAEDSYVHLGFYPEFRIFTDVSNENFGDQVIASYDGSTLYENDGRSQHIFYPTFFILINYYHAFEVVTVSPWDFDGIYELSNVNVQYIEFYE